MNAARNCLRAASSRRQNVTENPQISRGILRATQGISFAQCEVTRMSKRRFLSLFLTVLPVLVPSAAWAQTQVWTIDPGHSAATFQVRHMVVANVKGEFAGPVGTATYDPKDLSTLRIDATIDARTINTRN